MWVMSPPLSFILYSLARRICSGYTYIHLWRVLHSLKGTFIGKCSPTQRVLNATFHVDLNHSPPVQSCFFIKHHFPPNTPLIYNFSFPGVWVSSAYSWHLTSSKWTHVDVILRYNYFPREQFSKRSGICILMLPGTLVGGRCRSF